MAFTSDNPNLSASLLHRANSWQIPPLARFSGKVFINMISKRTVVMQRQGDDPGLNTISTSQRPSRIAQKKPSSHKSAISQGPDIPHRLGLEEIFFYISHPLALILSFPSPAKHQCNVSRFRKTPAENQNFCFGFLLTSLEDFTTTTTRENTYSESNR